MEKAHQVDQKYLETILDKVPDVYEGYSSGTASMILDLKLEDDFLEYHEENPNAKSDEILLYLFEAADLRPLPEA